MPRTTLNIDLDIRRQLAEYAAEKGLSLGEAATYLIASGLNLGTMGPAGVDLSDWAAVKEFMLQEDLDRALGSGHRESQHRGEPRSA